MTSINGVIFPESMADFLANLVDICFGSMPATSTTPAACRNRSVEENPPTHS
jgi:hypothetical protein